MSDRDELNQLRSEFNTQATVTPRQELEQLRSELNQPQAIEQPEQVGTFEQFGRDVRGGAEGFATLATGAIATPIAGVLGAIESANPFAEEGAGAQRVKDVQEALTFQPRTEEGKQALAPVQKLGEKLESGKKFLGEETLEATGSPFLASIAHTLPDATLSLLGLKSQGVKVSVKDGINIGKSSVQQAAQTQGLKQIKQPFSKAQTAANQKLSEMIVRGSDDADVAGVKLSANNIKSKIVDGLPRIVKDKVALKAIDQGLDSPVAAMVKVSNANEKFKFKQVLNIAERSLKNAKFAAQNSVGDVPGNSYLQRINQTKRINKSAGRNLDRVAETELRGHSVDGNPAMKSFIDDLAKLDVKFEAGAGNSRLNFTNSAIEGGTTGAGSAQNILNLVTRRMLSVSGKDNAMQLHKIKGLIDKQVKFGKTSTGGKGAAEPALKNLRRNIDNILDERFPEYNKVNTKYSETITELEKTQKAIGGGLDLLGDTANKALGTKLRSLTNNTQARSNLMNSMSSMEDILIKNGVKFKDRILEQVLFSNEIERLLKLQRKTGFKNQIAEAGIDAATGSTVQATLRAGRTIKDKLSGKSPENAIKAIRDLLKETK